MPNNNASIVWRILLCFINSPTYIISLSFIILLLTQTIKSFFNPISLNKSIQIIRFQLLQQFQLPDLQRMSPPLYYTLCCSKCEINLCIGNKLASRSTCKVILACTRTHIKYASNYSASYCSFLYSFTKSP